MSRTMLWVSILLVSCPVLVPRAAAAAEPEKRTVSVSAMAEVKVVPDQVVFTLGITTRDQQSLAAAKAANDRKTAAVLAVLEACGVPKDKVQIVSMQMGPVYKREVSSSWGSKRETEDEKIDHFHSSRDIEVVVTQLETVDQIVDRALDAGATHIGDLLFQSTKNREMQVEARSKAMEYAKEKAGHLAALNGLKLGKALKIEEDVELNRHVEGTGVAAGFAPSASATPRSARPWADVRLVATGATAPGRVRAKTADARPAQLLPSGIIVLSATVTITFEMVE